MDPEFAERVPLFGEEARDRIERLALVHLAAQVAPRPRQQLGDRVAQRGLAPVADVQRPGGVGANRTLTLLSIMRGKDNRNWG